MLKRAVFERSRREFSLDVSVGVHILLVVEQSSLERQSRGCAKTPILRVLHWVRAIEHNTQTHTHLVKKKDVQLSRGFVASGPREVSDPPQHLPSLQVSQLHR